MTATANDKLFIEEIRNHSEIYDYHNVYFWNKARKRAIWDDLNLKFKVNAKKKWAIIRGRYCQEKQKIQQNKQSKKMWSLYPTLQFLDDFLKKSYNNSSGRKTPCELLTSIKDKIDISADDRFVNNKTTEDEMLLCVEEISPRSKCGQIFVRNKKFIFLCEFCQKMFQNAENYMNHILIEHNLRINEKLKEGTQSDSYSKDSSPFSANCKAFQQNLCEGEFSDKNISNNIVALPIDLNVHLDKQIVKYELLNVNEQNTFDLRQLIILYKCIECNLEFENNFTFYIHNKNLHPNIKSNLSKVPLLIKTNDNKYICSICERFFESIICLRNHHRGHLYKKIRYSCEHCKKCFNNKINLKIHLNKHNNIRPYKCEICGNGFTNPQYLKRHKVIHTDNKNHSCRYCGKRFFMSSTRKYHEETVHEKVKLYQCEDCGETFPKNSILLIHKNRKHNPNYIKPKYECDICHISVSTKYGLKKHKFLHEGKKPYKCDSCPAKFSRNYNLLEHKKIHSDIKNYICKICGKKFAQSPGLYGHMKSHGTDLFKVK